MPIGSGAAAIASAAVGGGLDLLGGIGGGYLEYEHAKKLQARAHEFSKHMYKRRYRMTMKDMSKAGLNPILAYQQGGGSAPSGATVGSPHFPLSGIGSSAMRAATVAQALDTEAAREYMLDSSGQNQQAQKKEHLKRLGVLDEQIHNLRVDRRIREQEEHVHAAQAASAKILRHFLESDPGRALKLFEIYMRHLGPAASSAKGVLNVAPFGKVLKALPKK